MVVIENSTAGQMESEKKRLGKERGASRFSATVARERGHSCPPCAQRVLGWKGMPVLRQETEVRPQKGDGSAAG
jgi:hypothetical protein